MYIHTYIHIYTISFANEGKQGVFFWKRFSHQGCSMLQRVVLCCSVWQCVAVRGCLLLCVAMCGSVLQCVAYAALCACLDCVYAYFFYFFNFFFRRDLAIEGAVCCNVLQCVAECRSVLQCVAVCCSVLQCTWSRVYTSCTYVVTSIIIWIAMYVAVCVAVRVERVLC